MYFCGVYLSVAAQHPSLPPPVTRPPQRTTIAVFPSVHTTSHPARSSQHKSQPARQAASQATRTFFPSETTDCKRNGWLFLTSAWRWLFFPFYSTYPSACPSIHALGSCPPVLFCRVVLISVYPFIHPAVHRSPSVCLPTFSASPSFCCFVLVVEERD